MSKMEKKMSEQETESQEDVKVPLQGMGLTTSEVYRTFVSLDNIQTKRLRQFSYGLYVYNKV